MASVAQLPEMPRSKAAEMASLALIPKNCVVLSMANKCITSQKELFLAAIFVLGFVACSCTRPSGPSSADADTLKTDTVALAAEEPPVEEGGPIDEYEPSEPTAGEDDLSAHFTASQVAEIQNAKNEFDEIRSASDLAHFYMVTLPAVVATVNKRIQETFPDLGAGDDRPRAEWEWFGNYFPGVGFDVLCGECSYEAMIMLDDVADKAGQTPEPEDDMFFELATSIYGRSYDGLGGSVGNAGGWYTLVNCDFCAASLVGSGQFFRVLEQLEKARPAYPLFGSVMDNYRRSALAIEDTHYYHDKPRVVDELVKMLNSKLLTTEEKSAVREVCDRIRGKKSDSQFNCGEGNCNFGDM